MVTTELRPARQPRVLRRGSARVGSALRLPTAPKQRNAAATAYHVRPLAYPLTPRTSSLPPDELS